jgi:hypothetical protein
MTKIAQNQKNTRFYKHKKHEIGFPCAAGISGIKIRKSRNIGKDVTVLYGPIDFCRSYFSKNYPFFVKTRFLMIFGFLRIRPVPPFTLPRDLQNFIS